MKRTRHEVLTEFRSSEIVDAARELFSKRGFDAVTIDEIAVAAGMAKATVYQYFPSKQDIYLAALRMGAQELLAMTEAAMEKAQGAAAKVEAFVRTRLEYLRRNHEFFAVYHSEFGNLTHPAGLNREFRTLYRRQFDRLRSVIEEGVRSGEFPGISSEVLAICIYEATRGLMLHHSLGWS